MALTPDLNATGNLRASQDNAAVNFSLVPVPRLEKGEVHIWRLEPEPAVELSHYFHLLDRGEQDRAGRFRFQHLTRSFIVDHGRLRLILGAYTRSNPEDLVFSLNKFGKPRLEDLDSGLRFNLSHTEGLTLLALCLDAEIGIDVEAVRPMEDWQEVARSHFSIRENDALKSTIRSDRQNAFFRCWTRKEAFLKANGHGLSMPLDSFAVSLAPEEFPALLDCAWDPHETSRWLLFSLELGQKFIGALAIENHEWKIRSFDWTGLPKCL
ncbi:MAG TPA: 4'-phosphopantetheinyl transferase superfamily protein [Silvibacterium sp.]|nr:4'-phosphopantetheinyl transferase superfamily protein [Silvibacterium sp.]